MTPWLGVEIRHLSAFDAVASERSFSRAARKLGYTQSAISGQIAALERAVGKRLLDRGVGQTEAVPTPAGNLLLDHARTISARLHAAQADLAAIRDGRRETLRVGIYQSVGATFLPDVIERLRREAPDVRLDFHEAGNERRLAELVDAGACNALLPSLAVGDTDLHVRRLPARIPPRKVILVWHRYRTIPVETAAFVRAARQAAAAYAA